VKVSPKFSGRPPPSVLWYIDGQQVDETFDLVEGRDVVINKLRYTRYSRVMWSSTSSDTAGKVELCGHQQAEIHQV